MTYPENDDQFETHIIAKVRPNDSGYAIGFTDGWWLSVDRYEFIPQPGNEVRLYGKGAGHRNRGVFIDGVKVYYRTAAEQTEFEEIERFGKDVHDWLARWDDGQSVVSINMSDFGPGYEQALQIAAVEFLRYAVATWKDMDEFDACPNVVDRFYEVANGKLAPLNLSGTQIGAAIRLALNLFKFGPRDCFNDPDIADRIIRISKNFPRLD